MVHFEGHGSASPTSGYQFIQGCSKILGTRAVPIAERVKAARRVDEDLAYRFAGFALDREEEP